MRIEFRKIEIFNFKSFDTEVFEFDKLKGMNLICGKNNDIPNSKNASGKSSIFHALVFSLFGQTQENINNKNIANKFNKSKEVRVTTYFDIEDNKYKVSSGFNKYGGAFCELKVTKANSEEEQDLTKSTIQETRKFLEEQILHCDLSIFLRTIVLSADQNYNFFRLKKGDKKDFIEKMFDISIFGKMYSAIHKDILNIDKEIISKQNKLIVLNKNSDDYQNRINLFEEKKKSELNNFDSKLLLLEKEHSELKDSKISVNNAEVEKYEIVSDKVNKAIGKIQTENYDLDRKLSKLKIQLHKLQVSKEQKQKIIDKHADICGKLCEDCQEIFKDYYNLNTYISEIEIINKNLAIYEEEKNTIQNSIQENEEKIKEYENKNKLILEKIKSLTEEANKVNRQLLILENNIKSVKEQKENTEKRENPYIDLYNENEVNIQNETNELEKVAEKHKYLKYAENVVSQDTLRKFIVKDLVGILNTKIKSYLTKLGAKYDVIFDSDMNYTFVSDYGAEYEYDNFSSGEKARLMISACFTFRDFMAIRNNLSSNILVIDEFIDSALDSMSIEAILSLMQEFSKTAKQNIFIISHRAEINNDVFNNVIQVEKTNNISRIKYLDT